MESIEHIGIAVRDLNKAIPLYEQLLNTLCYKQEIVESEQVRTAFFKTGDQKIELLCSEATGGVIDTFIEKKGEGIHHIAFAVKDIRAEMKRLKDLGFKLLQDEPKRGADNKLICFVHPKSTTGVLIELCMEISEAQEL